jgi:hypothetical protein
LSGPYTLQAQTNKTNHHFERISGLDSQWLDEYGIHFTIPTLPWHSVWRRGFVKGPFIDLKASKNFITIKLQASTFRLHTTKRIHQDFPRISLPPDVLNAQ